MVNDRLESGRRLLEELRGSGFEIAASFWAKPSDEGNWFLYIASPVVVEQGQAMAHRLVYTMIQRMPELGIDPFEVRVVGLADSMSKAAIEFTRPKSGTGPFAVPNPRGIVRFGGSSFGGVSVDGAYIYPSLLPSMPA
jgi:hypothetical protein